VAPKAITLSLAACVSLCSDTPPASGCRPAPLHCQPETSACYSDPEGQASALRPPIGALPPSATILPPIRGLMNARSLVRGTRFICRRGQVCRRLPLSTPPGTWLLQWHLTAHSFSRSHPQSSPPPSIFWSWFRFAPLRLKNRSGLRVDRLRPTPSPTLSRHPSCVRGSDAPARLRPQTIFTLPFPLYPRHLRLRLRCRVRSHSSVPRNLRLLFRAVDAVLPRSFLHSHGCHTDSNVLPTHRGRSRLHSKPQAFLYSSSATLCPPQARCAVRRCTDYTPAVGQPLHSLRVCLRLRARAGRHIVLVQAHDKVPVATCLRDTCRLR
jgi:hypothetical protein